MRRRLLHGVVLATCLGLGGCRSLSDRIVSPEGPALFPPDFLAQVERHADVGAGSFRTDDGVSLGYRTLAPARRGLTYGLTRADDATSLKFRFGKHDTAASGPVPIRGTVVLLHGWGLDGASMLPWALAFGEGGFRAVLVDLRGHGRSRAALPGFGPREGADVAELVGTLRARGELDGPIYLLGASHGAVAALHAAAVLGDKVAGIVAISPYPDARRGIHGMVEAVKRSNGGGLRGRALRGWARWRYDTATVDAAMAKAGRRLGLDLATIDTGPAVAALRSCSLVLHGGADGMFRSQDIAELAARSPLARFVELPGETHLTTPLRIDMLAGPLQDWFAGLPRTPCPPFAVDE